MNPREILLLALEAANFRLYQARYAYDKLSNATTIAALKDAEELVQKLENIINLPY